MLYFSKIKIVIISILSIFFIILTSSNFLSSENNFFNKKINLGLDLQGGMHVVLEADVPNIVKKLASNKTPELLNAITLACHILSSENPCLQLGVIHSPDW